MDPEVETILTRFKQVVAQLKSMSWFRAKFRRPEDLVAEYYSLDRQLSQIMEFRIVTPQEEEQILPIWKSGYEGLYKKFPERKCR